MLTETEAFAAFGRRLEITGLQESVVAARQVRVRAVIERGLTLREAFLTGSYRRRTLITPLCEADVDIVVVLDPAYRRRGPRGVLDMVKARLCEEYRSSTISRNGQAVTTGFSDFTVDVVPAFRPWWDSGNLDICNSGDNTWISTSPQKHIELSSKVNHRSAGVMVPTVKMLKAWNRAGGRPLHSFHLEALAWKVLDPGWSAAWWGPGVGLGTDPENIDRFFAKAPACLRRKLPDPARNSGDLGAYLSDRRRGEAVSKLATARTRCARARELFAGGEPLAGSLAYREVFGDAFPR